MQSSAERQAPGGAGAALGTGVLCALPRELGTLAEQASQRIERQGLEVLVLNVPGGAAAHTLYACVGGVGKVAAARAATLLIEFGLARLLLVGTCGALRRGMPVGSFLHCETAFQADLALREGRETHPDRSILEAWETLAPGPRGWMLTADRPVLNPWRRMRLARAFRGPCAADMETAAVGAVAQAAGVPWAALRVVTDLAGPGTRRSFAANYPTLAGLPADTVLDLLGSL